MLVAAVCALVPTAAVPAATVTTRNFVVDAPTAEAAQQFAKYAEHYRRQKALEWIGREMPPWDHPCPLKITVTMSGASGATEFDFGPNGPVSQRMHIEGSYERLLNSVLPHEITHTVFAHHFRAPVPRWADEGGSVLSEDDLERNRHDSLCRQKLNAGQGMRLRTLLPLKQYPNDVMVLYAQGFSVTRFLVEQADRATFLNFVAMGMQSPTAWDAAAQQFYGFHTIEELEKAWIDSLRKPRSGPSAAIASRGPAPAPPGDVTPAGAPERAEANRLVTRDTSVPALQLDGPTPVVRGQSGGDPGRFGDALPPRAAYPTGPTRYGQTAPPPPTPPVRLGAPEWPH
jgi:hypothetical protein